MSIVGVDVEERHYGSGRFGGVLEGGYMGNVTVGPWKPGALHFVCIFIILFFPSVKQRGGKEIPKPMGSYDISTCP